MGTQPKTSIINARPKQKPFSLKANVVSSRCLEWSQMNFSNKTIKSPAVTVRSCRAICPSHRALEKKQENGETIELSAEGRPELVEEKDLPVVDCTCFGLPRRYIIAILSGIGFCISFGIRCNLGVAIVSMVNSHTIYRDNKQVVVVSGSGGTLFFSCECHDWDPALTTMYFDFCDCCSPHRKLSLTGIQKQ